MEENRNERSRRRLVVGDIHGCSRTFRALLEDEVEIRRGDDLYLLGDLVSKGPDSIGVLRYVENLEERGINVSIIRGNHEEAILRARDEGKGRLREILERTRNTSLLEPKRGKALDPRWERLFERSVYVASLPDAILVHGGVDLTRNEPYADGAAIVNARETVYDEERAAQRPVIHGHTRAPLSEIIERLVAGASILPLDNGAVAASNHNPFKVSEYGNLCCLDLDRWSLHIQPNRDVIDDSSIPGAFSIRIHVSR
ncbi:MAG: metallophosphoesterase [Alkalispirochaeta sp.]